MEAQENKVWGCYSRMKNQYVNICLGQITRGKKKKQVTENMNEGQLFIPFSLLFLREAASNCGSHHDFLQEIFPEGQS